MNNRKINILGFILLMLLVFVSFYLFKTIFVPNLAREDISQMTMTMVESRGMEKTVTGRDDINRFVFYFNALELEYTVMGNDEQDWKMLVGLEGEKEDRILITSDRIRLNRSWYKADPEDLELLKGLYSEFNYPIAEITP
jgi:uncharacterized protein YpmB